MPGSFAHPLPNSRRRTRSSVLVIAACLGALVACADRVVAPAAEAEELVTTPVQSLAVSDVVERVAGSLPVGTQTTQLNTRIARLREQMESGRLESAASSLVLAREALETAREADDGAMAADLTVVEMALDEAGQLISAIAPTSPRKPRQ